MFSKFFFSILLTLVFISSCQNEAPVVSPNIPEVIKTAECPLVQVCDDFEQASYDCGQKKMESECPKFISIFKSLLKKGTCPNPTEDHPRADLMHCYGGYGKMPFDYHYNHLAALKSQEAQELYSSQDLRDTMDGDVAEEHMQASLQLEKKLKKNKK